MTIMVEQIRKRKVWNIEEVNLLSELYDKRTPEELVQIFKTSYRAIVTKANVLGIYKDFSNKDEQAIIYDFNINKLHRSEIKEKYNIPGSSLHRILSCNNCEVTKQTGYGKDDDFKTAYSSKTVEELIGKYKTSYKNIKLHAHNLGLKRPKELINCIRKDYRK